MISKLIYYWQVFVGVLVGATVIFVKVRQASELEGNQLLSEEQLVALVAGWLLVLLALWCVYLIRVKQSKEEEIVGELVGCRSLRLLGKWSGSRYYFLMIQVEGQSVWYVYDDNYTKEVETFEMNKNYTAKVKGSKCIVLLDENAID